MAGQSTGYLTAHPQLTREMTCDPPQSAGIRRALSPGPPPAGLRSGRRFCYYSRDLQIPRPLHLCLWTLSLRLLNRARLCILQEATPGLLPGQVKSRSRSRRRSLALSRSLGICRQIRLRSPTTTGLFVSLPPTCRRVSFVRCILFFFFLLRGITQFASPSSTEVSHDVLPFSRLVAICYRFSALLCSAV